jgi:hypothetical protein
MNQNGLVVKALECGLKRLCIVNLFIFNIVSQVKGGSVLDSSIVQKINKFHNVIMYSYK